MKAGFLSTHTTPSPSLVCAARAIPFRLVVMGGARGGHWVTATRQTTMKWNLWHLGAWCADKGVATHGAVALGTVHTEPDARRPRRHRGGAVGRRHGHAAAHLPPNSGGRHQRRRAGPTPAPGHRWHPRRCLGASHASRPLGGRTGEGAGRVFASLPPPPCSHWLPLLQLWSPSTVLWVRLLWDRRGLVSLPILTASFKDLQGGFMGHTSPGVGGGGGMGVGMGGCWIGIEADRSPAGAITLHSHAQGEQVGQLRRHRSEVCPAALCSDAVNGEAEALPCRGSTS